MDGRSSDLVSCELSIWHQQQPRLEKVPPKPRPQHTGLRNRFRLLPPTSKVWPGGSAEESLAITTAGIISVHDIFCPKRKMFTFSQAHSRHAN